MALLPCYSYSDSIKPYYGVTNNAAANNAIRWSMGEVLPSPPGITVNNVLYRYTPQKETEDAMKVHIGNQSAFDSSKWIWRETDDWTGVQGGIEIRKVVPVPVLDKAAWGDGSIEVEGTGTVTDANVVYTYTVDPCYDPQFSPQCPGYKPPIPETPEIDLSGVYDGMDQAEREPYDDGEIYEDKEEKSEEEKEKEKEEEERDSKERLEKALSAADNSVMFATALAQSQMLDAMNSAIPVQSYYNATIPGGVYRTNTVLVDKKIPENRRGLRNGLAQQILHQKMVEMQYSSK